MKFRGKAPQEDDITLVVLKFFLENTNQPAIGFDIVFSEYIPYQGVMYRV
jgi:hypothetical protein